MTYSTVMVAMASDQPNAGPLAVAAQLGERFEARLIGIAASDLSPPPYYTSGIPADRLLEHGLSGIRQRLAELEVEFRGVMRGHAREVLWRSAVEPPAKFIASQARAADVVITSASGRSLLTDPFAVADPTDLIMQVGRPLLVVPAEICRIDLSSMLVAWKDNPEARRAIAGALPLLRQASHVTVVEILEDEDHRAEALACVHDVVEWLSRHHIHASGEVPARTGKVAEQLDTIAAETGAGVVIAGAYGHSRFREWILGGVTRHLIGQTTRCALLAR